MKPYRKIVTLAGSILLISLSVTVLAVGCGEDSSEGDNPEFEKALTDFSEGASATVSGMGDLKQNAEEMVAALEADDLERANALVLEQTDLVANLEQTVTLLQQAEAAIEALAPTEAIRTSVGFPTGSGAAIAKDFGITLGIALAVTGIAFFTKKMKERSDKNIELYEKCGKLLGEDEDQYKACMEERLEIGKEVIKDLVEKSVIKTGMPLKGAFSRLQLKMPSGSAFQKGLKVLSATAPCAAGFATEGCIVGAGETDDNGEVEVPVGNLDISVSGSGKARVNVQDIDAPEGGAVTVTRDLLPIEDATPAQVMANDKGEFDSGGGGDPDIDVDTDTDVDPDDKLDCSGSVSGTESREGMTLTYTIRGVTTDEGTIDDDPVFWQRKYAESPTLGCPIEVEVTMSAEASAFEERTVQTRIGFTYKSENPEWWKEEYTGAAPFETSTTWRGDSLQQGLVCPSVHQNDIGAQISTRTPDGDGTSSTRYIRIEIPLGCPSKDASRP